MLSAVPVPSLKGLVRHVSIPPCPVARQQPSEAAIDHVRRWMLATIKVDGC